jgi:predicted Zn-dependent protease
MQLWSETFEGDLGNLFALQDQVTARIGNSIGEHMVIAAAHASETRKSSSTVADLLMRARALNLKSQSIENFTESESLYRKALSQEPNNLIAMAGLAVKLAQHAVWLEDSSPARKKQLDEARDLALRVRAIEPSNVRIYLPLAIYAMEYNDFDGAQRAYEAMVAHDPKNPAVYNNLGLYFREMGEPERALPLLKQALALYPKGNEMDFANLGAVYLALGDNKSAIEWLSKSADVNVQLPDVYAQLAMAYSNIGDRVNATRYVSEYKKRAAAAGIKESIDEHPVRPGDPAAYTKYVQEHYLPEWKKAGLP